MEPSKKKDILMYMYDQNNRYTILWNDFDYKLFRLPDFFSTDHGIDLIEFVFGDSKLKDRITEINLIQAKMYTNNITLNNIKTSVAMYSIIKALMPEYKINLRIWSNMNVSSTIFTIDDVY